MVEAPKLISGGLEDGTSQGYWDGSGVVTSKGQQYFRAVSRSRLVLHEGLTRNVVEVTGIADAVDLLGGGTGGLKEAQFEWEYGNPDDQTRRFIVRGGTGVALLRRYDDGWRTEDLRMEEGVQGFVLTSADLSAAERDRDEELARRRAEEERLAQLAESERQQKERRDARIAESKIVSRTIRTFVCLDSFTGRSKSGNEITVSDVSVRHNCRSRNDIWFGDVTEYQSTHCRQTAMNWRKPCVVLRPSSTWFVFDEEAQRDEFFAGLDSAVRNWRLTYPDLLPGGDYY